MLFQKKYEVRWGLLLRGNHSREFEDYAEALSFYAQKKRQGYKVALSETGYNSRDTLVENVICAYSGSV